MEIFIKAKIMDGSMCYIGSEYGDGCDYWRAYENTECALFRDVDGKGAPLLGSPSNKCSACLKACEMGEYNV
jgi:hypothetical protein